jgi:ATP-dependent Zn protease
MCGRFTLTRRDFRELAAMLGGRAAEELVFHEVTTGAANDIEKVTHTSKQMIMRFVVALMAVGAIFLAAGMPRERAVEAVMAHPDEKERLLVRQEPEWQRR